MSCQAVESPTKNARMFEVLGPKLELVNACEMDSVYVSIPVYGLYNEDLENKMEVFQKDERTLLADRLYLTYTHVKCTGTIGASSSRRN